MTDTHHRAWALYRRHRKASPHPVGWFDDRLWTDCVERCR